MALFGNDLIVRGEIRAQLSREVGQSLGKLQKRMIAQCSETHDCPAPGQAGIQIQAGFTQVEWPRDHCRNLRYLRIINLT